MEPVRAYVGLGSNLGQPAAQILSALDELAGTPGVTLRARSSLYRTAPMGYADQPDFINAVAEVHTTLAPKALLRQLLAIEQGHGRVREFANGPRTLDLDILLYGDLVQSTPSLELPHPRAHLRAFVLRPLVEIAPQLEIPGRGPAAEWLRRCEDQDTWRIAEEVTLRQALGMLAEAV